MKPINYPDIVRNLRQQHDEFFNKYRLFVEKNVSERLYERESTSARLKLIAKALVESGAVLKLDEVDILGHSSSIVLTSNLAQEPLYLLNDCTDIIVVTGGIASADAISGRIALVTGESASSRSTFFKRYNDVLNDAFDWGAFANEVLDAIHRSVYSKEAAQKDFFTKGLFGGEGNPQNGK